MASLRITVALSALAALLVVAACMPAPDPSNGHHHTIVRIHVPHKIHHVHHHHVKKVPVFVKEEKHEHQHLGGHYKKSDSVDDEEELEGDEE